ncbi:MAG: fucose isomerase [Ruminococcaceae bacterium]|nr:fucose isomerase [Oscillospiraceae bacterium]
MELAYLPIGVPTFHLESAGKEFEKSVELLKEIDPAVKVPAEMLLSIDKLHSFTDTLHPDLVVVQNITFANGAYMTEILRTFDCPVMLWTLREPVIDGGRLRLNSLTGAYSAANMLASFGRAFGYVFGAPREPQVKEKIAAFVRAVSLKKELRSLNLLQVGHTPQGFGFGRGLDAELASVFGTNLISIEARELINTAKTYTDEEVQDYIDAAASKMVALDAIPQKNVTDFAKLFKAYDSFVKENNTGALSSRCWPDFFTEFGTPVCAVLAMLNDLGVPASCEADTYGALSMFACAQLTGNAAFFGDPVSMDETENTITFWHCGMAPCSLAREDTGAVTGVHCNRKIGPTLEFGCKAQAKATIFRIGKDAAGKFRFFIAGGEVLDKPKQFSGTTLVVKTKSKSEDIIYRSVKAGWEPHFAVAMGDIESELEALAQLLNIEVEKY